jgi:hypothetical protein
MSADSEPLGGIRRAPQTRIGLALTCALADDMPVDELLDTLDDSFFEHILTSGEAAVAYIVTAKAAAHRFGRPPDVRGIARWIGCAGSRLDGTVELPFAECEAVIRVLLGESWLEQFIEFDRVATGGEAFLNLFRLLIREYMAEIGIDAKALVVEAEKDVAAGGFPAELADAFMRMASALTDPDSPQSHTPAGRAFRTRYGGLD